MLNQSFSYVYNFLIIKFNDNYTICDSYSVFLYSNLDWEFNNKDVKYIFTLCHVFCTVSLSVVTINMLYVFNTVNWLTLLFGKSDANFPSTRYQVWLL